MTVLVCSRPTRIPVMRESIVKVQIQELAKWAKMFFFHFSLISFSLYAYIGKRSVLKQHYSHC